MHILNSSNFDVLWEGNPVIIFDTNSILDLYRNAPSETNSALSILREIPKDQLFIPNQVYKEYQTNKNDVVRKEHKKITNVKESVEKAVTKAKNTIEKELYIYKRRGYPSTSELDNEIEEKINQIKDAAKTYVEKNKPEINKNKEMLINDKIESLIESLKQEGSVGKPFSFHELINIYTEGEMRYNLEIPPGYNDKESKDKESNSKGNKDKTKKYGDLIIWKQALQKASQTKADIIYVTSDKKEWVEVNNGVKIPDHRLILEFKEYSDEKIYFTGINELIIYLKESIKAEDEKKVERLHDILYLHVTDILNLIISNYGEEYILEGSEGKLTNYLLHSGDLAGYLDNLLGDVEINSYGKPEIVINSIEVKNGKLNMDGEFSSTIDVLTQELFSSEYTFDMYGEIEISGFFTINFNINDSLILKNGYVCEDFLLLDSIGINTGGYEITDYTKAMNEEYAFTNDRSNLD